VSSLWSDLALARAALAEAVARGVIADAEHPSRKLGRPAKPLPVRKVLHPRLSSVAL